MGLLDRPINLLYYEFCESSPRPVGLFAQGSESVDEGKETEEGGRTGEDPTL